MDEPKQYLITGATSGIGYGVCESLLQKRHYVYGIGRDETKVNHLIKDCNFKFLSFDLNHVEKIENVLSGFLENHRIDGVVNCAGMEETLPISIYSPEKVEKIFTLNVFAGIELLRVLSKKKFSNESASFVFLSSVMGLLGQPGKLGYCATKAALLGLVKASALELSKRRIRVNCVSPGVVNTPMTQKLFANIEEENRNRIINMHPLGLGEVADIVPAIEFLLSNESKWITGQNIIIDGGYSIQ